MASIRELRAQLKLMEKLVAEQNHKVEVESLVLYNLQHTRDMLALDLLSAENKRNKSPLPFEVGNDTQR